MKVLHVYRTYFPDSQGGLEEVIRQICLNTQSEGVESRIFTLSSDPTPGEIEADEGRIVRVKLSFEIASCGFCFGGLAEFRRQVEWADLVHYHFPWPYADVLHVLAGHPSCAIVTYHSDIVRQRVLSLLYQPLMKHFLGSMARIVATSPDYLASSQVLSRFRDRFKDKVDIAPIGIEPRSYPVLSPDSPELLMAEAEQGRDFFLFIGVLRYYKGLHVLLEAAREAPFQVVIAGTGPEEASLHRQAQALGLDNVRFCGYISDERKVALLQLCRGVVLPSHLRSEAFGVTLLEGAMCGKPLVSANVGTGTGYININGETGLVVTPASAGALRAAMDRLHEHPDEAAAMGDRARERFDLLFTGAAMGRRYAEIYQEVTTERGSRAGLALNRSD